MGAKRSLAPEVVHQNGNSKPYRGIRMRKWGRWVVEMRIPRENKRIWLGSYDTPEKAARAYDAAQYCFHGSKGRFNFPADQRPEISYVMKGPLLKEEENKLKDIAASFASRDSSVSSSVTSQVPPMDAPVWPDIVASEIGNACKIGDESMFAPAAPINSLDDLMADNSMDEWINQLLCNDM